MLSGIWRKSIRKIIFHYPFLQAVLLALTVAAVQLILTFAVTKSFRRTSLIERVRYSE